MNKIEEIIEQLDSIIGTYEILIGNGVNSDILGIDDINAIREAIEALEQEPFINKPCVSEKACEHDKNKVLDKIRAEIMSKDGLEEALEIIDKYKEERSDKE